MLILEIYQKMIEDHLAIPTIRGLKSNKEKFVGAEYTTTLEGLMTDGKALQMATSHHLGQNFSKPFEIKFLGKDSHEHFAWQTSWGVSWRLIGAIVMIHGDDKGIIMPPKVAPIQVIIIPIFRDREGIQVKSKAFEIANELKQLEIRVQVDDRDEYTSGWKFNEWEVQGYPLESISVQRIFGKIELSLFEEILERRSLSNEARLVNLRYCFWKKFRRI